MRDPGYRHHNMAKHGPEMHYIRPDGVYITSVLQPTVGAGFNPVPDTMAIAARFVAPTGLAGPMGQIAILGRQARRSPTRAFMPFQRAFRKPKGLGSPIGDRWRMFVARVRANFQANRFVQDMRFMPAGPGVVTMDTSPRPINTDPTALAVQSGWAPSPQSPASASNYMPAQGDPGNNDATVLALNLAPSEAGKPIQLWQRIMQSGLPPIVAARAEDDIITRWFKAKASW